MTPNEARVNAALGKVVGIVDIQECTCRKFVTGRWPDGHCGHIDFLHHCNASKMLLAKLAEKGFGWQLQRGLEEYEQGRHMFHIWKLWASHRETHRAYGATEEEAVVKVACAAFGIPWEES